MIEWKEVASDRDGLRIYRIDAEGLFDMEFRILLNGDDYCGSLMTDLPGNEERLFSCAAPYGLVATSRTLASDELVSSGASGALSTFWSPCLPQPYAASKADRIRIMFFIVIHSYGS